MAALKPKAPQPPDPTKVMDLALNVRRGKVRLATIPEPLQTHVALALRNERALAKHAIRTTETKQYGRFERAPATLR